MSDFKVGDMVVEDNTGDVGKVVELIDGQSEYMPLRPMADWQTGLERGQVLAIGANSCCHFVEVGSITIESCIKFLTEQGFSVTLTKV